jgi:hypothetical protein
VVFSVVVVVVVVVVLMMMMMIGIHKSWARGGPGD